MIVTVEEVRAWVAGGESLTVEFKGESRERLNDTDLVEAAACMANARGGVLLIGVEDDGAITGAQPRHGSYTDIRRVEALVGNQTQSRESSRGALDFSAIIVPDATWDDLDPLEFERMRQTIARNGARADAALLTLSDVSLVKALGLGDGGDRIERIRVAGLLLLGREESLRRLLPTHEVAFQAMSGTRVNVNDFLRWPLIKVSDELTSRFDARNEEEEIMIGAVRAAVPDYSRAGYREAVHNALVHRDYAAKGAVHVFWRNDEIEVASPGGFPDSVKISNLLVTGPRPRSPVLADAFKRIGLVERTGRGIDTIFEGQLRNGRPAPDYSRSSGGSVQVVLPGGPANLAMARFIIERDTLSQPVTLEEMLVVNAVESERRIDVARAAELLQKGEPAARAVLERLVEAGVMEARGERQQRVYLFTAATYRAIGPASAYTRAAGFEPLQQEQMVLAHLRAHGRMTRSDAAELCRITSITAKSLLRRLLRRGLVVQIGAGKSTYYQIGPEVLD